VATSLKDKVVLITGASSGFGYDTACMFAREGSIVILAARREERLVKLAENLCSTGLKAFPIILDVSNQAQVDQVVQAILEKYGHIDILFNNAGFGRLKWLEKLDPAHDINEQIDVNLRGLIQVTRAVLPSMLARRSGHIINMSSVAGLIAAPLYSIYAATKFGVRGFTDALRREVAPFGIKISGIYPGPAKTEFGQHTGSSDFNIGLKPPDWLSMSSEYVARRTIQLAKHPRSSLVLPWYYRLVSAFESLFPGIVDWILQVIFVKRVHRL
jgi:uncharacterized protein